MHKAWKRLLPNWRKLTIHPTAEINCRELSLGDGTIIGPYALLEGRGIAIGREAWLDRYAYIGGGSCNDPTAFFKAGDWLHMGRQSHVNTARGVTVGHEFGCGVETKIFTHGAYESELDGFPVKFASVQIGQRVWLPNAWVNPGVTIGDDVVVAARSLVNKDLPAGCLAGGTPARVLQEHAYPKTLTYEERNKLAWRIVRETMTIATAAGENCDHHVSAGIYHEHLLIGAGLSLFNLDTRSIEGQVNPFARLLKNQLRRHGIRFRYEERDGVWQPWETI